MYKTFFFFERVPMTELEKRVQFSGNASFDLAVDVMAL